MDAFRRPLKLFDPSVDYAPMTPPPVATLDVRDRTVSDPRVESGRSRRRIPTGARRAWAAPLRYHAALLLVLLAGLATWIGPGYSFSNDEGASVLQAQAMAHGHWVIPAPIPRLDPGGRYYPIELSAGGPKGYAPLGKHLFYGLLLSLVYRLGGLVGMVGLSLLGTVACALLAAAVSRELAPNFERPTLWFTALGTPLLFDGFLIVGQTVAAALVTTAALLVLRHLKRGDWRLLPPATGCGVVACLLRTEGVIWCGAMAGACVLAGFALPRLAPDGAGATAARDAAFPVRRGLEAAGALSLAALVAREADQQLTRHALGAVSSFTSSPAQGQSLLDQVHGGFVNLLQAGSDPWSVAGALMAVTLGVVALAARLIKRGRGSSRGVAVVAGWVLVLWSLRAISGPSDPIPGLAVAAPVLWLGIWVTDRSRLRSAVGWITLVAPGLFFLGVLATEYGDGGGLQWGGRFYTLSLPLLVPAALVGLARARKWLAPGTRHLVAGVAVVVTLVLAGTALWTLRSVHQTGRLAEARLTAVARQAPSGDDGAPVFVTSAPVWPRFEWQVYPDVRWQLVSLADMRSWSTQLAAMGVTHFVLVTSDPAFELMVMSHHYRPGPLTHLVGAYSTVVFSATSPSRS